MIKQELLEEIIADFQEKRLPNTIKRDLQVDLAPKINRAIIVMGPRRVGKTFYLYSLMRKLEKQKISRSKILYINFEDPRLAGAQLQDLLNLLRIFYQIYPQNKKNKVWFFFDEIQNILNWEKFIRGILDLEQAYIYISGSSSKLLSQEIATAMRGRSLNYLLLPFNFNEFLRAKKINLPEYLSSSNKSEIMNAFTEYFTYGGYPEVILYPKVKDKIISEIIQVTIHQDLIERYNIRNTKVIKLMFNFAVQAHEFSIHKFFNYLKSLNIKVSKNSLYNYLDYYNEAFIFYPLRKFSLSLKKLEQSIPKIYVIDNGLIEAIIRNNKGMKLENLAFLSLLQQNFQPNDNIFYYSWQSGEIDFVLRQKEKVTKLIQVSFDISVYQTKEREIKALLAASKQVKCDHLEIITWDYEEIEKHNGKTIKFIPLWKRLLGKA